MFVRTAMPADLAAIAALVSAAFHGAHDALFGRERAEALARERFAVETLRRRLIQPHSEFIVADDGKALAGMAFAAASDDGKTLTLHQIYVRPELQRHGVGGMLMDEILNAFPDAETCDVDVAEGNARAIAFYESYGFAAAGAPFGELRHICMTRPLGVEPD